MVGGAWMGAGGVAREMWDHEWGKLPKWGRGHGLPSHLVRATSARHALPCGPMSQCCARWGEERGCAYHRHTGKGEREERSPKRAPSPSLPPRARSPPRHPPVTAPRRLLSSVPAASHYHVGRPHNQIMAHPPWQRHQRLETRPMARARERPVAQAAPWARVLACAPAHLPATATMRLQGVGSSPACARARAQSLTDLSRAYQRERTLPR